MAVTSAQCKVFRMFHSLMFGLIIFILDLSAGFKFVDMHWILSPDRLMSTKFNILTSTRTNLYLINNEKNSKDCKMLLYMAKGRGKGKLQQKQFVRNRGKQMTSSASNPIRVARVARALRDELSSIICEGDIKAMFYPDEELLRSTSIMEVEVSADLGVATAYISVMGNSVEKRQVYVWLCENVGQVRFELHKRLKHMKKVPEVRFKLADTQTAADLVAMIEEISESSPTSIEVDDLDFEEFDYDDDDFDDD